MKKFFTAVALFSAFVAGAWAAEGDGYRRTWDFTKGWSEETLEKLTNDPDHWEPQGTGFQNKVKMDNGTMKVWVNGEAEEIPETQGLSLGFLSSPKHAQVFSKEFGSFPAYACLWINGGKSADNIQFKVPAGENVRIGYTTHKNGESRGFTTSVLADANGNKTFKTDDASQMVEVVLVNNNTEEITEKLTSTSGHHIYYIIIGEGDKEEEQVEETPRVAYLYQSSLLSDVDADAVYASALGSFENTAIDLDNNSETDLAESLLNYNVVVFSNAISEENTLAKQLFWIVNKVPVLNLNANLLKGWGVGEAVVPATKSASITVSEDYREDVMFENVEMEEGVITLFDADENVEGNLVLGYSLNENGVFAGDDVIATVGVNINAIHMHGKKNSYMLLPLAIDNMDALSNGLNLINAMVDKLAKTKAKVSKVATPSVKTTHENLQTTVELSCRTEGAVIYYTIDGSEPTTASAVYSEPFVVTEDETTLRAFAVAHGYFTSDTANVAVRVFKKLAAPTISIDEREGENVITLSTNEDANIYYAFQEVNEVEKATLYEGPITVKDASTIYAFAEWATAVQSETAHQSFQVGGVPAIKDTVAYFKPSLESWGDSILLYKAGELIGDFADAQAAGIAGTKGGAYYPIGLSALPYYTDEVDYTETVQSSTGADSTVYHYKRDLSNHFEIFSKINKGWVIKSDGQVVTTEKTAPVASVSNSKANGYYAETALDLITGGPKCNALVDFNSKYDGAPYNMSVQTTEKIAAPFYVEAYLGNGSTKPGAAMEIQVSADGVEWKTVQVLNYATNQRYWKRTKVHFAESGEYYVRIAQMGNFSKPQLYDVMVMTTEGVTGIETLANEKSVNQNDAIYDLMGRRVAKMESGRFYQQNGRIVLVK